MGGRYGGVGRGLDGGVVALVEMALVGPPPFLQEGAVFLQFLFIERERPMPDFGTELGGCAEESDKSVGCAVGKRRQPRSVPFGKNQRLILKHIGGAYFNEDRLPGTGYITDNILTGLVSFDETFDCSLVSYLEKLLVASSWVVSSFLDFIELNLKKFLFFRWQIFAVVEAVPVG